MKLSAIVVTYNSESCIEKCLNSILAQSFENWECIIIDDESTDNTLSLSKKFESFDHRFKVISKFHTGQSKSRNVGIQLATGDYICFIDSTIELDKDCFELASFEIDRCKANALQFNYRINGTEHNCNVAEYDPEIIKPIWNKIYRTSFVKANSLEFKDCSILEDLIFNTECYELSPIISLCKTLCTYYPNSNKKVFSSDRTTLFIAMKDARIKTDKMRRYVEEFLDRYDTSIDYIIDLSQHKLDLKYKLRAVEKWMPWIGTIHLLVNDNDIPEWLNKSRVNVVNYKDFIPAEYLPTSNSKTAEVFCFNIKGLSSKFIFSNDHCVPNFTLKDSSFYTHDYKSVKLEFNEFDFSSTQVSNFYRITLMNDLALANRDVKSKEFNTEMSLYEVQYTDKPLIKRHCIEAFEKNKDLILKSLSPQREAKNISINYYSEYSYLHYNGENVSFKYEIINADESPDYVYRAVNTKRLETRAKSIALRVNENYKDVNTILAAYYKDKSSYEL